MSTKQYYSRNTTRQIIHRTLIVCLLIVSIVRPAIATNKPSSPTLRNLKAITHRYILPNGLTLIVREDKRSPAVVSQVWYRVGSSDEQPGITGIAHLLEHMMFRGSEHYPGNQFARLIAEQGGYENAMTDYDYTMYFQVLQKDKLALSFKLEADRMAHASLEAINFEKEREVVMEERRLRVDNQPKALTQEHFIATAYLANPYHTPVIGWMHDLKHLSITDTRQFYKRWYAPNNAILVVVGDVKAEQVLALAKHYFGSIPKRPLPLKVSPGELFAVGKRVLSVFNPATSLPWVTIAYQLPSRLTAKNPSEVYALIALNTVLGGYPSSRLPQNLIKAQKIVSNISSHYAPYQRYNALLTIEATPSKGHSIDEVLHAIHQEITQLQTQRISPQELSRVKLQMIANRIYQRTSIQGQAFEIGMLEAIGLSWEESETLVSSINAVTAKQIQAVARRYLDDRNITIAKLRPLTVTSTSYQLKDK